MFGQVRKFLMMMMMIAGSELKGKDKGQFQSEIIHIKSILKKPASNRNEQTLVSDWGE